MSEAHFLAPRVLFFNLSWLPRHFLQRCAEIGFLPPHLKHTLKNNLRCWAICFLVASVMGIYLRFQCSVNIIFTFPFSSGLNYQLQFGRCCRWLSWTLEFKMLRSYFHSTKTDLELLAFSSKYFLWLVPPLNRLISDAHFK
jgi:hypothetical protein